MSLLAGLGSIVGGLIGASSADKAAKMQAKSSAAAIAEQRRQFDLTRGDLSAANQQARADVAPWMQAGQNALGQLQNPTGNFQASPDYAWRRSEGERGIGGSFAARGGAFSGNALKALSEYNSNLASGEFGNWWNRQAGLANVGQSSAGQAGQFGMNNANALGQFGANTANNIGNAMMAGGDARASGVIGGANALTQGLSGALDAFQYFRNQKPGTPPINGGQPNYGWSLGRVGFGGG